MSTAVDRVQAFLDLWTERRSTGGQYSHIIYSLGTHDDSVDLTDSDIRKAFAEVWDEAAERAASSNLDARMCQDANPYRPPTSA